jgi:hypothetical protein
MRMTRTERKKRIANPVKTDFLILDEFGYSAMENDSSIADRNVCMIEQVGFGMKLRDEGGVN